MFTRILHHLCVLTLAATAIDVARAQNLLTNPGFEAGTTNPAGWRVVEGEGTWTNAAHSGVHAITARRKGGSSAAWHSERFTVEPGGLYRLQYFARRSAGGGSIISGISNVNRDFSSGDGWTRNSFVFVAPHGSTSSVARLGQWEGSGTASFDDVELVPVLAAHRHIGNGADLGEAESIHDGVYHFSPNFGWLGANYHRTLYTNRAGFNSDRWNFSSGTELIYRLGVRGIQQRSASVQASINYHVAGTLLLEASSDAATWQSIGELDAKRRTARMELPGTLFPSEHVFVRLRATSTKPNFQVNRLDYEAPLADTPEDLDGATQFLGVREQGPELTVRLKEVRLANAREWSIACEVSNRTEKPLQVTAVAEPGARESISVPANAVAPVTLRSPATQPGAQTVRIELRGRDKTLFAGETDVRLHLLLDPRPGYWLSESDALGVWWCESGWKIGRDRGMPAAPANQIAKTVEVSAARGEYEAVQVILTPRQPLTVKAVHVDRFRNEKDQTASITTTVDEVAYVAVKQPTDGTCERGQHPDPLPPFKAPFKLEPGVNQPLWLTFHVPANAAAGDYSNDISIETTAGPVRVPVRLHVYDFEMPKDTHLRSAFGLGTPAINRYHRLTQTADKHQVFDKYLQNFVEHRISPYSFSDYAPMEITFPGTGTNKHAAVDFSKFDEAAERWLATGGFSTFQLRLRGMGGGTFESRSLGKLEGFEEGTPEHARLFKDYLGQVEAHLRARGWLDKAFTYWFDEPDPKDYEFVVAGMKRLKAAAPGIQRMLTEQPEPTLIGNVDIWCGLTPEWTREKVQARRAAGEKVWWYICTGPKAPYVTEFIDHAGTELRLWPWQSWQYGVEGILVWASTYWTSGAAFPSPTVQDPWRDPMSYVSGYNFGAGHVGYWGNGDGRFVYPPRRDPNTAKEPDLSGPINSVRWENLRDGMEDYEYFWLLDHEIARVTKTGKAPELVREAKALLTVPEAVSKDLTHFTTDPRPMLSHREKVAHMIERLAKLK